MRARTTIAVSGVVGIAVALALVGWLVASRDNSASDRLASLSHSGYAQLWQQAVAGHSTTQILNDWPKPYQHYSDGSGNDCYEWDDKPVRLYNLCFKHGVLVSKSLA